MDRSMEAVLECLSRLPTKVLTRTREEVKNLLSAGFSERSTLLLLLSIVNRNVDIFDDLSDDIEQWCVACGNSHAPRNAQCPDLALEKIAGWVQDPSPTKLEAFDKASSVISNAAPFISWKGGPYILVLLCFFVIFIFSFP